MADFWVEAENAINVVAKSRIYAVYNYCSNHTFKLRSVSWLYVVMVNADQLESNIPACVFVLLSINVTHSPFIFY
jgi:hypothetical protein